MLADPAPILIGEVHGTAETPRAVAALVCHSLAKGERVVPALEWRVTMQARLDRLEPQTAPTFSPAYLEPVSQDGRASQAMMALVSAAIGSNTSEQPDRVRLLAFDSRTPDMTDPNAQEEALASALVPHIETTSATGARLIVLTGNLHAARGPLGLTIAPVTPMAARLGNVTSLVVHSAGGTAWICQGDTPECGPQAIGPDTDYAGATPRIRLTKTVMLSASGAPQIYDGAFEIGAVTASSPAPLFAQ
jgi:hypothetical protein